MKQVQPPARPPLSPAARFRPQIEAAVAAGVAPEAMTLRLTFRDAHVLSRDPVIPVHDIRYDNGTMYFLGVRIERGGIAVSLLEGGDPAAAVAASAA